MVKKSIVVRDVKLSSDINLQKEVDKISKELALTINNGTISENAINGIQTTLSKSTFKINLDLESNGVAQQIQKAEKLISDSVTSNTLDSIAITPKVNDNMNKIKENLLSSMNAFKSLSSNLWAPLEDGKSEVIDLRNRWDSLIAAIQQADETKLSGLSKEVSTLKIDIISAGYQTKTFGDLLRESANKLTNWFTIGGGVSETIKMLKQMYQNIYDIDTAMTSLYKVTDETDFNYNQFLKNASTNAKELGRTIPELINQTKEWTKLGFDLNQSERLSKISSIYANVGDVDDKTAILDIAAALNDFDIKASDAIKIIDIYNKLGNEFSVASADIGKGIKNSASSLASQGNSIEQVVAMLAGAGEITHNVGELGNMLKVVSLRLASMKDQLQKIGEEYEDIQSVSNNQAMIYRMTNGQVDIINKQNGKLKDTYTILKEVAAAWNDVGDSQKNDLLELIFGTQRADQGTDILTAFQSGQIDKAYAAALNASGSAMEEQARWLDSLEAKTQQFEAAFQSLSQTFLSSELFKNLIDGGTLFVNVLEEAIDLVGTVPTLLTGFGTVELFKNLDWPVLGLNYKIA